MSLIVIVDKDQEYEIDAEKYRYTADEYGVRVHLMKDDTIIASFKDFIGVIHSNNRI